jgi:hypothetical protein
MVRRSIHSIAMGLLVLGLGGAERAWPGQAEAPAARTVVFRSPRDHR